MEKFKFNVIDRGETISFGIKPNFDIKAWRWFNFSVRKSQIKYDNSFINLDNITDF